MRELFLLCLVSLAGCDAPPSAIRDKSDAGAGCVTENIFSEAATEHEIETGHERLTAQPSNLKLPTVPEHTLPGEPAKPRKLERDGVIADRFTAPRQSVAYTFEANAGELSLFELGCWGYARGWHSGVRMRVLDEQRQSFADLHSAGKVLYRPFLAFTAPRDGTYTLELSGEDQFFRFILVRQSSYSTRDSQGATPLGATETVHSYLSDAHDSARFSFELAAHQEVAVKVLGEREEARTESRAKVRERSRAAAMAGPMSGAMPGDKTGEMARAAGGESMSAQEGRGQANARMLLYPPLAIELRVDGKVVADGAPFALVRSDRACTCEVRVHALSGPEFQFAATGDLGGLFELQRQTSPPKLALHGVVVGPNDEALAGIELAFLEDPDGDEWGRTTTAADGSYKLEVPAGDYLVMLGQKDGRTFDLRVGITEARELDLLWASDSR